MNASMTRMSLWVVTVLAMVHCKELIGCVDNLTSVLI